MTITSQRIPISSKESEALLWGLGQIGDYVNREVTDPADPLSILLADGWTRRAIASACDELSPVAVGNWLAGGWTELEVTILRLCVEKTSWIEVYRTHDLTADDPTQINQALAALRSLARKLDLFGVEINQLAN